jgi:hypothetical protein
MGSNCHSHSHTNSTYLLRQFLGHFLGNRYLTITLRCSSFYSILY